jgi:hypothetical protein
MESPAKWARSQRLVIREAGKAVVMSMIYENPRFAPVTWGNQETDQIPYNKIPETAR